MGQARHRATGSKDIAGCPGARPRRAWSRPSYRRAWAQPRPPGAPLRRTSGAAPRSAGAGQEGIVAKRRNDVYEARAPTWIKIREPEVQPGGRAVGRSGVAKWLERSRAKSVTVADRANSASLTQCGYRRLRSWPVRAIPVRAIPGSRNAAFPYNGNRMNHCRGSPPRR
jgi:hypothetical protein